MAAKPTQGTKLTSYMISTMEQSEGVLLNVIKQPLYASATVTAATPQAQITLFQTLLGSSNLARTNIEASPLAWPKAFFVRGVRIHKLQNVAVIDSTLNQFINHVVFGESYTLTLSVGDKAFIQAPMYYFTSGLGVQLQAAAAGAEATDEAFYTSAQGVQSHDNYFKIPADLEVVIPPMQGFKGLAVNSAGVASLGSGSDVVFTCFLEGALARETN